MGSVDSIRKPVAIAHNVISFILILASLWFSMMPVVKLDMSKGSAEEIKTIMHEVDGDDIYEELGDINITIEVTPLKVAGCVNLLAKLVNAGIQAVGGSVDEDVKQDLDKSLRNPDGTLKAEMKESILIAGAVVATILSDVNFEDGTDVFATVFKLLASLFAIIYILIFSLIVPIVYLIIAIIGLVQLLKYLSEPEKGEDKLSGKLFNVIALPVLFFLFPCVTNSITYGMGTVLLVAAALANALVNIIFSRTRKYNSLEFKNANILQCVTVLSLAGYIWFFYNIIKTGILRSFIGGPWAGYAADAIATGNAYEFGYYLDAVLIIVAAILVIVSVSYFTKSLKRISLLGNYRKPEKNSSSLVLTIFMLLAGVLPFIVSLMSHEPFIGTEKIFFLKLTTEQNSTLIMALVGLIVAFVSEVLLLILKGSMCRDGIDEIADEKADDKE